METAATVAELIAMLQALPPDLPVYLGDWNEQFAHDAQLLTPDNPRVEPAIPPDRNGVSRPRRVVIGRGNTMEIV